MYGFYINLDERIDRFQYFENLKVDFPFFNELNRFNAIKNKNGAIGCGMSHIKILDSFIKNDNENVLMLCEDDICILNKDNFLKFIELFFKIF